MNDDTPLWFYLLVLVLALPVYMFFANWSCHAKWDRSGLTASWGLVQGCMVQLPDGRWLPEERVREIEIQPKAKP